MKQIILEGPDGAGKSTLLARIMEDEVVGPLINNPMPSFSVMQESMTFKEYIEVCLNPRSGPIPPRIYDRFFYSELVYGPILRGEIALPPPIVRQVRNELADTAFLIYCRLPYETLVERATERSQKEGVINNLHRIYRAYEAIMGDVIPIYWLRNAYAMYDQTQSSYENLVKLLTEYLNG